MDERVAEGYHDDIRDHCVSQREPFTHRANYIGNCLLVIDRYASKLAPLEQEVAYLACLDEQCYLIEEMCRKGTKDSVDLSVEEVVSFALKCEASRVVLIHNHPSGDPSPSAQDRLFTIRLLAELIEHDIVLDDHVIIGHRQHFSFRSANIIPCSSHIKWIEAQQRGTLATIVSGADPELLQHLIEAAEQWRKTRQGEPQPA